MNEPATLTKVGFDTLFEHLENISQALSDLANPDEEHLMAGVLARMDTMNNHLGSIKEELADIQRNMP